MKNCADLTLALTLAAMPAGALRAGTTGRRGPPQAGGGRGGRAPEPEIRPYDRVITKDAKSDDGIFTVHRIKDRVYYEIPKAQLGREFLWVSQIAQDDARRRLRRPGGRQPRRQVGAPRRSHPAPRRLLRRRRRCRRRRSRSAVDASNYNPIVMAFNIEALGKDDARGDRRDAALHDRRAGVQRPHARRRARLRCDAARSSSAPSRFPRTSRSKRPTPTTTRPSSPPRGGRGGPRAGARRPRRARRCAPARTAC